ncbi:MAG: DUF1080 domain-containing protein, partial [Planctomycetaceae bacterium]|nr:DUF1080 domain-containing protein [Planctomycetaceae bacterium]
TALVVVAAASFAVAYESHEWLSGINWLEPRKVTPGVDNGPPSDALVLFGGADLSQWEGGDKWLIQDGVAVAHETGIQTKQGFGDCQLHLEFAAPEVVEGDGQGRGNSGIYFQSRYEVQVLDSWENPTYFDGQCGAIYKQHPPLVNASKQPGEWQTYDIVFIAPRFNPDGSLLSRGTVTVLHNGIVVQNHWEITGATMYTEPPIYHAHGLREPIQIQFHGNPVKFRNIWIRDLLPEIGA